MPVSFRRARLILVPPLGAALSVAALCAGPARVDAAAQFYGVGDVPGGNVDSRLVAVSADGQVAVGSSEGDDTILAVYWTRQEGLVSIGDLPGGLDYGTAAGASADGSVIVGLGTAQNDHHNLFRWTRGGGMVDLGPVGTMRGTQARGASADASVIAGEFSAPAGLRAFRWRQDTGVVALDGFAGGPSSATRVSRDGSVVVGYGIRPDGQFEAVRWTASGIEGLGHLSGTSGTSLAHGVNADGSVVVGHSAPSATVAGQAFVWREGQGMTGLGLLDGLSTVARAVSADGSVIVGEAGTDSFIWDPAGGLRSLRRTLAADGIDVSGWKALQLHDLSADGTTLIGTGVNPAGQVEGFVVVLPEPAAGAFAFIAAFTALRRPRRPRRPGLGDRSRPCPRPRASFGTC